MNITNNLTNMAQLQWTVEDPQYPYMDTWLMTEAEYTAMTPAQLAAKQTKQYNDWLDYIKNPTGN